ncbi:MAG: flagellar M-ring protein FliF [Succinivibrionaceae bacterium]|nr:flagellar M-ring protein FliF [Succinivibrionaceae bacterium]
MSDRDLPVATGAGGAEGGAVATVQGPAAQAAGSTAVAAVGGGAEAPEATPEVVVPEQAVEGEKKKGGMGESMRAFFANGEVMRRMVIIGFLVIFLAAVIFALISMQGGGDNDNVAQRELGRYSPQEIGKVLDFLDTQGFAYELRGSETVTVNATEYTKIREAMLRQGIALPAENKDEGDQILMTDSGFGVSQRMESERIKHGREMQLAAAIERIEGVSHATVLLAIPRQNVFARQQSHPTAAVVVTLKNGFFLSPENVNSIRFTVASSVHNMMTKDVTVTDQNGRLLSAENYSSGTKQDKLEREFELRTLREAQYRDKLDSILAPMLGLGNYTSEVDVTLDTTLEEETSQLYNPDSQAVRSETLKERRGESDKTNPYGVPGSLSNQPPANASIPQQLKDGTADGSASESARQTPESREAVRNYEVDTTVRHTVRPSNSVTRLTVSVAVDYMRVKNEEGLHDYVPRPQADLDKIAALVKGGLGLDERRGDFVRVETVSFPHPEEVPPKPWWQEDYLYRIVRVAGAVLVILILVVFVIRPMVNRLIHGKSETDNDLEQADLDELSALEGNDDLNLIAAQNERNSQVYTVNQDGGIELPNLHQEHDLLKAVRTLVSNEPQLTAEVIKEWLGPETADSKKD